MNKIFDTDKITLKTINMLFAKEYGITRIKDFYQPSLCNDISTKILDSSSIRNFIKAKHVKCMGVPHFNIVDTKSFEKYHMDALSYIEEVRNIFYPYLSPVDQLRLQLDEIWPSGANVETLYGRKCFVGLCRILDSMGEDAMIQPHIDMLERDSSDSYKAKSLLDQLACNIYLSNYHRGGELNLWFKSPTLREYDEQISQSGSYHVDPDILGKPDLVIRPEVGDLILFSSRYYHAVGPGFGDGCRISMSAFIGYRGNHEPLTYWS